MIQITRSNACTELESSVDTWMIVAPNSGNTTELSGYPALTDVDSIKRRTFLKSSLNLSIDFDATIVQRLKRVYVRF